MEMVQPKYVSIDRTNTRNVWWYPYDQEFDTFARNAVKALYHESFFSGILIRSVPVFADASQRDPY